MKYSPVMEKISLPAMLEELSPSPAELVAREEEAFRQRMEAVVNLYHALGGGRGENTLREKDMKVYDSVYEKATRQTRADRKKAAKEIR